MTDDPHKNSLFFNQSLAIQGLGFSAAYPPTILSSGPSANTQFLVNQILGPIQLWNGNTTVRLKL